MASYTRRVKSESHFFRFLDITGLRDFQNAICLAWVSQANKWPVLSYERSWWNKYMFVTRHQQSEWSLFDIFMRPMAVTNTPQPWTTGVCLLFNFSNPPNSGNYYLKANKKKSVRALLFSSFYQPKKQSKKRVGIKPPIPVTQWALHIFMYVPCILYVVFISTNNTQYIYIYYFFILIL